MTARPLLRPEPGPVVTVTGGPVGMTPEAARAIEEAIDLGRRIRAGSHR